MKKKLAAAALALVLLGLGIVVASGTGGADPLVTRSYLETTFLNTVSDALKKRASANTQGTYDAAVGRLDALGEADLATAGQVEPTAYTPTTLQKGDALELKAGGSLVLYSGAAQLSYGALADVTSGETIQAGGDLTAGHRYIATANVSLRQTAAGSLGYQGEGTLRPDTSMEGILPFTDVAANDWYYNAVSYVFDKGYFSGTSETTFEPNTAMNRGMLATVLHRVSGGAAVPDTNDFSDVPAGKWYTQGVAWASKNGVVNGMGDGTYQPSRPVTREQMVTMLYRYQTQYLKKKITVTGDLSAFPDGDKVSDWAKDAMAWATGAKIINGRDTGHLDPSGTATRAEVAAVLQRFSQYKGQ